jgi:Spy/CpxP family protein refolding chaperone
MNNTKFLKVVIMLLLLINISAIAFMWFNRPQPKDNIGDFFAKELHFTDKQKEQFNVLRDEHRQQRQSLKALDKEKHDAYFDLIKNTAIDSTAIKKAITELLKIKEKEELGTFSHFQKVRAICDETQKEKFDKIIGEATRMMAPRPPREVQGPPRGEDGPPPPRP